MTVKAFATLRNAFDGRGVMELDIPENASIGNLIEILERRFKFDVKLQETGEANPNIKILVNGREIIYLDGLRTKLKNGDVIAFIPPVGGG